jgi:hypothetical protein
VRGIGCGCARAVSDKTGVTEAIVKSKKCCVLDVFDVCLRSFSRVLVVFWLFIGQYLELEAHTGCSKHVWVRGLGCSCAGADPGKIVVTGAIVESKTAVS